MRIAWIGMLVFLLVGCDRSDFEGFKKHQNGVHYKLITIGDDGRSVDRDVYVSINALLEHSNGDFVARKRLDRVLWGTSSLPPQLKEILNEAHAGDSIVFKGNANNLGIDDWFRPMPIDSVDTFQLLLSIHEVLDYEMMQQLKAEERMAQDRELQRYQELQQVLDSLQFDEEDFHDGIYFRSMRQGNGDRPVSGSIAFIHYLNHLSDGTLVYDTHVVGPFEYHVGKPDQVIPGFGVAIAQMRVGGKALFVVPSDMAFGDRGSSDGLVPPYTALIYQAELVEVRK